MKTKRILLMGMMAFFLGSTSVSAQGLGGIFKKAKKYWITLSNLQTLQHLPMDKRQLQKQLRGQKLL